jgi:hypothetical protein
VLTFTNGRRRYRSLSGAFPHGIGRYLSRRLYVDFGHHLFYAVGKITYEISRMALTRPRAGVAVVAFVDIGLLVLLSDCAHACSCGGGVPFRVLARGADASAVLSGEVLDVE